MLLVACRQNTNNTIFRIVVTIVLVNINTDLQPPFPEIMVDVTHFVLFLQNIFALKLWVGVVESSYRNGNGGQFRVA